ncbi:5'-nucleotidase C-terminal domain-containing protein [Robertkochia sp. 1368]|nr:5'-nucleotidase C-terminal domain-containing protein [Robertkochia sediminum]
MEKVSWEEIEVTEVLEKPDSLEQFVAPYRKHLDSVLAEPLCYAPTTLSKSDGQYNTAIGNLLCDIIYEQGAPIFESRTGKKIDMVLINHGGIRAVISQGPVTRRTAYEVMPFENTINVLEISSEKLNEMVDYLVRSNRPHPFSGLTISINENGELLEYKVNGRDPKKGDTYFVATSNYLANMGDNMKFFGNPIQRYELDYLIRNAMIDYFEKTDTLRAATDKRFAIIN